MSDANPTKWLGQAPRPGRQSGWPSCPVIFVGQGCEAVVYIETPSGANRVTLEEAAKLGHLEIKSDRLIANHRGEVILIIKSNKLRIFVRPKS